MLAVDTDGVGIGTTANGMQLHVVGNTNIVGTVTATSFVGEGSGLTNLSIPASGWAPTDAANGYYNTDLSFVGIGTSTPGYTLEVGDQGDTGLDLVVNGMTKLTGLTTVSSINVTGILTASNATLTDANVSAGIVTATGLSVGVGSTSIFATTIDDNNVVGIGTTIPRAKLDIEGAARFKTYSEHVEALDIASSVVEIDLSLAQSFTLTVDGDVDSFRVINIPSGSTSFSIKILQDGTGNHAVGIDTFKTLGGTAIPVNWPGGGVVPIMTQTADRADIYSYKTFDGGSSFYGVVGGQNFA